jgi:ATP-dependent RNA helicase DOB1
MLLNLMRIEDADPERMMQFSFHQFQNEKAAPAMEVELKKLEDELSSMNIQHEEQLAEYFELCAAMEEVRTKMQGTITQAQYALPYMNAGRLVRVQEGNADWGWGVVVSFQKRNDTSGAVGAADSGNEKSVVVLDVLLACDDDVAGSTSRRPRPQPLRAGAPAGHGELKVVPVLLPLISAISSIRIYLPKDLKPKDARTTVWDRLKEVNRRFPQGLTLLDPVEDMRITTEEFRGLVAKSLVLQSKVIENPSHTAPDREARLEQYQSKVGIKR